MIAPDVNVLLYALREESDRHSEYRNWLRKSMIGDEPLVLFEPVMAAVLRIATHRGIFKTPTPRRSVEQYLAALQAAPATIVLRAGEHHWNIFLGLIRIADCQGNKIQDAYLAALALEQGTTWITTDRDFARFPGLVWRHPLDLPQ